MSGKPLIAVGGAAGVSLIAWRTMFPWIKYDWQTMKAGKKMAKRFIDDINNKRTIIDNFEATVNKYPKKPFVILDYRCFSYEYVNEQACRVANIVIQWNLRKEDSVSIFVHNSVEYIWTFLGLQKLGVITTLLNINIRGDPLVNAIQVTDTKAIIVGQGDDLYGAINEIRGKLDVPVYFMGDCSDDVQSWDMLMIKSSPADISPTIRSHINIFTSCCYIFTSGTTGLPKAALISHGKALAYPKIVWAIDLKPEDVMYDVLPFYHATGLVGWLAASEIGCTVVIRRKFSAHQFWEDCRKYKVTLVQYIGELLRYLIALPEDPLDGNHNVKYFIGNGLRQDIWIPIQKRFKIPYIMEFFGASEGTALMYNMCNKPGAVGRISPLMNRLDPAPKFLLKYDLATATPIRNKSGRCIEVRIGEPGLLICGIPPTYKLENGLYKGSMEMTEKKIVRNVFKEGDAYFNFGDSLYMDKDYFVYFHDRVGDTFRWKGENVSTTEVANIITALSFIIDANVYGVKVPGHDGRAGMASLVLKGNEKLTSEKLKAIYHHCEQKLPKYSRPIVLRHEKEMRTTGTFKQHKVVLMEEGFDPKLVSDPMFYLSTVAKTYVPLNQTSHLNFLQSKL